MIKVSVVIPVYNAEKHLERCIASLLAQTIEAEFVFVNDGSKDKSKAIIEKHQVENTSIVLINQENQGVSAARNAGIAAANGEYFSFVDADDFAAPDMLEVMYAAAKNHNADIVITNYIAELNGVSRKVTLPFTPDSVIKKEAIARDVMPAFFSTESLNQCWNKLYNNKLFTSGDVSFPLGMAIGEDGIFNLKAFHKAQSIVFLDYAGYHYLDVDNSATRDIIKNDYFKRALDIYNFDYAAYTNAIDAKEVQKLKAVKLIFHVLAIIGIYLGQKQQSSIFKRMAFVKKVINDKTIAEAVALSGDSAEKKMTRYQKFLLNCVRKKNFPLLMMGVLYSTFRKK